MEVVLAVEQSEQPVQGLAEEELACAAPRWGACDQLLDQGLVFRWAVGAQHDQEEGALGACGQGASHRLVGLEEGILAVGRGVEVEDRDRDVVEEEEADHRLRTVVVAANPAVSKRYAPGQMPAIVLRRA